MKFLHRPKIQRRQDFALVLTNEKRYKLIPLSGDRVVTSFPWDGNTYQLDNKRKRRLVGIWRPGKRLGFFSDLLAQDGIRRNLTLFQEPKSSSNPGPVHETVQPLDRLTERLAFDALTPQIHRTYFVTSVYRNRMRKLRIGGIDLRLVLIIFGILALILAFLYFSGYLTG